jgi:cytochrome c-type biogenesis protein CcmH/NrfF
VWIVPVVALVVALAGLTAAFARWRRREEAETSDEDRELVERALHDR